MLLDESDELTSWYDSGWLGRDILTQSKIVMYWTYCAIEGLAMVWTCIINQEISNGRNEMQRNSAIEFFGHFGPIGRKAFY